MTIRFALCALITIPLLALTGCDSTSSKESASQGNTSTQPATNNAVRTENGATPGADDQPVVIDGDLNSVDWRSMIGQQVTLSGDLVIVDTFDLSRRGQVKVARDRLHIPTNRVDPNDADPNATSYEGGSNVAKVTQAQKFNDRATIILDDGSADENIHPPRLFPDLGKTHPTVRIGSVIDGVSGKLVAAGRDVMLVPSEPLKWTPASRPSRPEVGPADVTVASFNVLNYFTTIDNGRNGGRGADSESELNRQEEKLVSAILALNADVIGLMELENNLAAENRLVAALNNRFGDQVFRGSGLPDGFRSAPGGENAIRVGILYRSDRVEPIGEVTMIHDDAFELARTPLVQSFQAKPGGRPFTLVVNHFKSKGGSDRADEANKNKGDGQGAYNVTRTAQALAICNFIDQLNPEDGDPRVLVIGDLNAYGQEDPIDAMRAQGLVDLQERFGAPSSPGKQAGEYSFIYYGQCGSLDHAMATQSLASDVTGIATWHINADEPRFLDYNQEHNPQSLYEANPFRSSDHDPVLIGIGN